MIGVCRHSPPQPSLQQPVNLSEDQEKPSNNSSDLTPRAAGGQDPQGAAALPGRRFRPARAAPGAGELRDGRLDVPGAEH